jgi:malonate transporter MadL subunit
LGLELEREGRIVTIFGVALLSICTLVGVFIGDVLGVALGVKANVGGVGLAMMLLIAARYWLQKRGALSHGIKLGIEFWGTMYIPIVVAMAAQQNVVAALRGGPLVLVVAIATVVACFLATALLGRIGRERPSDVHDVVEVERGGDIIAGDLIPDVSAKKV